MNKVNYLSHNWLAMRINNRAFMKVRKLIKGIVIDMGCGDCQYKQDILKVADDYIGVDWPNTRHEIGGVDVWADLTERLPFPDGYADTIISFQVMEHLNKPLDFLKECSRILKSGGRLIITAPFMWGIHEEPYDYYRYTKYGLKHLLQEAGFTSISVTENAYFWSNWILRFNYHSCRYGRGMLKIFLIPIWFFGQVTAIILDKLDKNYSDVASYTATAVKP